MSPQTILITGATGKIGQCLTRHFRTKGWDVIAVSRNAGRLDTLERESHGQGALHKIDIDLTGESAAVQLATHLSSQGPLPHHLINNARDITNLKLPASGHPNRVQWRQEFELGVVVAHDLTFALAEVAQSRLRSVVNVGSIYGVVAMNPRLYNDPAREAPIHYGVTKAALIHMTKELAVRLAARGIRVNCVSYGGVAGRANEEFRERYAASVPAGTMLDEHDIPGAIDFLTSPSASGITGHNLLVDGGWTAW